MKLTAGQQAAHMAKHDMLGTAHALQKQLQVLQESTDCDDAQAGPGSDEARTVVDGFEVCRGTVADPSRLRLVTPNAVTQDLNTPI